MQPPAFWTTCTHTHTWLFFDMTTFRFAKVAVQPVRRGRTPARRDAATHHRRVNSKEFGDCACSRPHAPWQIQEGFTHMGVDGGVPCRSGRPQNAWAASSRRHKGRSEQPGLGAPAPRWQQRVLRSLSPFPRLPRCVPLAAETPTTSRGCRLQLRARNGVEEPAQDFHVRGHVVVVDGGSASRRQAATSHPQHGKPWSWEAGESQTAAGGWSNRTNASAAKATAVVADVTTHSKWCLDMQV